MLRATDYTATDIMIEVPLSWVYHLRLRFRMYTTSAS